MYRKLKMSYLLFFCAFFALNTSFNICYAANKKPPTKKITKAQTTTKKSKKATSKKNTETPKAESSDKDKDKDKDTDAKIIPNDPLKTIVVQKSKPTFSIILKANPTTGYSWALKNYDPLIITPVKRKFHTPATKSLIGSSGYEEWTFRVKPAGFVVPLLTSINLIYMRPWDNQGAQASNFKVVTENVNKTT